jgi:hypothetical protein
LGKQRQSVRQSFQEKQNWNHIQAGFGRLRRRFVADGNKLRGRTARCTIKSRKQVGDTLNLLTACATDIMLQNVEFTVKFFDDNKISRLFPGMEGMEITYYRCAL